MVIASIRADDDRLGGVADKTNVGITECELTLEVTEARDVTVKNDCDPPTLSSTWSFYDVHLRQLTLRFPRCRLIIASCTITPRVSRKIQRKL